MPLPAQPLPEPHYRRLAPARRSPGAVYACVSDVKVVAKPTLATEQPRPAMVNTAIGPYKLQADWRPNSQKQNRPAKLAIRPSLVWGAT